jgi:hypothetical protein
MARERYTAQVQLLVRALPIVAREDAFALKGGTAINLFYRDMPRLSVDIDLTYLPSEPRNTALSNIDGAFERIRLALERGISGAQAKRITGGGGGDTRLSLRLGNVEVKIEVSPVMRGTIHPSRRMTVTEPVEDAFGFAEMPVVAFEDLFAGKLCAAVDRQHPRDLYDVKLLYDNEGLTDPLFSAFLVYVACSGRPLHEMLDPNLLALDRPFAQEFEGMTNKPVSLGDLIAARTRLFADIRSRLDADAARFLLSIHDGAPDFAAIGLPAAEALAAIQWKLINLRKLATADPQKHAQQRLALEKLLAKP